MFYTPATAYSQIPSEEEVRRLREDGWEILVLKPDS
jgi:hypothetical protein